jgi:hypothetical protein
MKKSKVFLCREEKRWEFLVLHVRRTGFLILLRSPLEIRIMSARDVRTGPFGSVKTSMIRSMFCHKTRTTVYIKIVKHPSAALNYDTNRLYA